MENDGSLYRINPADGSWAGIGKPGIPTRSKAGASKRLTVKRSGAMKSKPIWQKYAALFYCLLNLHIRRIRGGTPPDDPNVPPKITVLCACHARETRDNPLNIAVAEALYGRADYNHDGVIDAEELIRYTRARYKEMWPNPTAAGSNTPVIVESKSLSKRH